ncbi:UDP-N-acetylmuramate--L-alanine ligase [Oceanithermus sp.]
MKHVHFMGIGGVGISALAYILHREGWRVSGCDAQPSALAQRLAELGVEVHAGHSPEHVHAADLVVASNAVPPDHPELVAARERGVPQRARMQVLAEILGRGRAIGVSGTHGKTTTTSMIAHVFIELGQDPVVLVGAAVPTLGGNARWGEGRHRIAEVDESDPLFADVSVDLAVLTNLEDDHVAGGGERRQTYHADYASLREATRRYAERAGRVLYNADWDELEALTRGLAREGYGFNRGRFRAEAVELDGTSSRFVFRVDGRAMAKVRLAVPGRHNVENALAALAAAYLEGLDPEAAAAALASFEGAARRFQTTGHYRGAWVVDDYAHHPTEVAATLKAARATGRQVRVVFQPHRYLRTQQMWPRFAEALMEADEVWVLDVFAASEPPIPGVHGELIAERLRELGHPRARHAAWGEVLRELRASAGEGDLILTMGAGDVWRLGRELVEDECEG